jgi:hypothetical protein
VSRVAVVTIGVLILLLLSMRAGISDERPTPGPSTPSCLMDCQWP